MDLILRRHLSEPNIAKSLVLLRNHTDETESVRGDVYFRWEDDDLMAPQYIGSAKAGSDLVVPFELKGRAVRLWVISKTADGNFSANDIKNAPSVLFQPDKVSETYEAAKTKIASEDLFAGALINIWNDGGVAKARLADASNAAKPANAFVLEAIASGTAFKPSVTGVNTEQGGTAGATLYLSTTPGTVTETFPTTAVIKQVVGTACSADAMIFEPEMLSGAAGKISLIKTFTFNLNSTADQTLYTVPTGFRLIVTFFILRDSTAELAAVWSGEEIRFGINGTDAFTPYFSDEGDVGTYKVLHPNYPGIIMTAAQNLTAQGTAAIGSAQTIIIDVFGYLLPV